MTPGCVTREGFKRCWRQLCLFPQHREAVAGEGSYVWTLPFGLVGLDPGKDVRDLENMTVKKNWQDVGLLNW